MGFSYSEFDRQVFTAGLLVRHAEPAVIRFGSSTFLNPLKKRVFELANVVGPGKSVFRMGR
jgi:hypothetical protein